MGPLSDLVVDDKGFIYFVVSEEYYAGVVNKLVVHECHYNVADK